MIRIDFSGIVVKPFGLCSLLYFARIRELLAFCGNFFLLGLESCMRRCSSNGDYTVAIK